MTSPVIPDKGHDIVEIAKNELARVRLALRDKLTEEAILLRLLKSEALKDTQP
jgi:hypothetical protein